MSYQWIPFDADGTLFDYDKAEAAVLEQTFAAVLRAGALTGSSCA